MTDREELESLDQTIGDIEETAGGATRMMEAFSSELKKMNTVLNATGNEVRTLSRGINRGLKKSLEDLIFDGDSLSSVLRGLGTSIVRATYNAGVSPVTRQVSEVLASGIEGFIQGALPFAKGASFAQGRIIPFASGGVVNGPTAFPMRGATGLMGEAGPEAIMPLARGADGRLGVQSSGNSRPINVVINVTTPDAASFARSQSQIATQVTRALGRASRNR